MAAKRKENSKTISKNRVAYHDYNVGQKYEAGIVLKGTEVKSLRTRGCDISDGFCIIRNGECFLINVHIPPYKYGNRENVDPDRRRKLLLHKKEIRVLNEKTTEKGKSIIPLVMYFNEQNMVKIIIALAEGKKLHDKREDIKRRDTQREVQRELKNRNIGRY